MTAGAPEASIAYTLAAIKDWTFWLGPGWVVGWGNGLILGYLMYSSGLVPRKMAMLGLVGRASGHRPRSFKPTLGSIAGTRCPPQCPPRGVPDRP